MVVRFFDGGGRVLGMGAVAVLGLMGGVGVARGATIYDNLAGVNGSMAAASRPDLGGKIEIEAADDFATTAETFVNHASFTGLIVPSVTGGTPTIGDVDVEIYRVFPKDSNTVRTPNVVTRANSPSDVAFDSRDAAGSQLTFTTSTLSPTFTALNSVLNGINKAPNQTTGGEGAVTGVEVTFSVDFATPFDLPADHYFFVPQVQVTGGEFYWLSSSRPVVPNPFPPGVTDLQAWIRNANLDPDWSRVGTDVVGGTTPPTFNMAFELDGVVTPLPGGWGVVGLAVGLMGVGRWGVGRGGRRET